MGEDSRVSPGSPERICQLRVALGRGLRGGQLLSFLLRRASRLGFLLLLLARAILYGEPISLSHCFIEEGAQLLSGLEAHVADNDVAVGQENPAPAFVPGMRIGSTIRSNSIMNAKSGAGSRPTLNLPCSTLPVLHSM